MTDPTLFDDSTAQAAAAATPAPDPWAGTVRTGDVPYPVSTDRLSRVDELRAGDRILADHRWHRLTADPMPVGAARDGSPMFEIRAGWRLHLTSLPAACLFYVRPPVES